LSKRFAASLKTFLSKNSFELHEKILKKEKSTTTIHSHFGSTLTSTLISTLTSNVISTLSLIFIIEEVLKCRQKLFILNLMLLRAAPSSQSFRHEIISTISLVKLRRRSSMTLPTRENVDSELMIETCSVMSSLARIDSTG
jgi:hypothetical protein